MFNVNWPLLILRNLPVERRKQLRLEWLRSLFAPLIALYNTFIIFRADKRYDMSFTGQIIYMERLLNDKFNNGLPAYTAGTPTGIYISDPTGILIPLYLWNKVEQRPVTYLYNVSEGKPPVYLRNQAEIATNYEFVVNVPDAIGNVLTNTLLLAQIRAWVDKYRPAGKRYTVVNYTP